MARKNSSDRRCSNGKGNFQADGLGNLDDVIAADAAEEPHVQPLRPENRRAQKLGVKIRLGLPAEEE